MVERIADLEDVGGRHDGCHHVIDTLEGLEGTVEESQHGLVLGHIDGMEDGSGRHARLVERRPCLAALLSERLPIGAIQITDADEGTALAAELGEAGAETVGTAWDR